jgi:hypothetical protein
MYRAKNECNFSWPAGVTAKSVPGEDLSRQQICEGQIFCFLDAPSYFSKSDLIRTGERATPLQAISTILRTICCCQTQSIEYGREGMGAPGEQPRGYDGLPSEAGRGHVQVQRS